MEQDLHFKLLVITTILLMFALAIMVLVRINFPIITYPLSFIIGVTGGHYIRKIWNA